MGRPVRLGGQNAVYLAAPITRHTTIGILLTEGKYGEEVSVAHWTVSGTVRVRLDTAVYVGSRLHLVPGDDNRLTAAASEVEAGEFLFARALEDGKAGDLIEATIFEPITIPATP
jgi:hypothetical protein